MPYYIYRVTNGPFRQVAKITERDAFKEANVEVKRLRQESELPADTAIRMIFAENELQAEELLMEVREPQPILGDDI